MPTAHFGVMYLPFGRAWPEIRDAACGFEAMGFDSFWIPDHVYAPSDPRQPTLEAWSLLSGLAAVTERIQLGTLVTPAGLRNPSLLGKVIASVDQISGGRIIPGFGSGWSEREFSAFGMPFHSGIQRLEQMRETVQFLQRFWRDPSATYEGDYVRVVGAVCEPKPLRPLPVLIAGGGEKVSLRIVAEEAAIWNNSSGDHEHLERKLRVLRQHCEAVGREFSEILVSQQCLVALAEDAAGLERLVDETRRQVGSSVDIGRHDLALTGTPARLRDQIQRHLDLRCSMFILDFFGTAPQEQAAGFAERVLPHFR